MYDGRLIVEGVNNWAHTVWLKDKPEFTLGRSSECDVMVNDSSCSKQHAKIILKDGCYYLRDLGSSNGTFINGRRIEHDQLKDGDIIKLGDALISFLDPTESRGVKTMGGSPAKDSSHKDFISAMQNVDRSVASLGAPAPGPQFQADLEKLKKELAAMTRQAEMLARLNALLFLMAGDSPFDERLAAALDLAARAAGAENGFVMLINPELKKWVVRARFGAIADWTDRESRPVSLSLVKEAVSSATTLCVSAKDNEPMFSSAASIVELDIKAVIAAPILAVSGKALGVVYVDRRKSDKPFPPAAREEVEALAAVLRVVAE